MIQSPFPGMNPYLEARHIWPDVHNSLMYIFRQQLSPKLAPKYTAELETELIIDEILPGDRGMLPKAGYADVTIIEQTVDAPYQGSEVAVASAPLQLIVPMEVEIRLVSLHIRHRETDQVVTVVELLSPVNKRTGKGREKYLAKRRDYLNSNVHLVEIDLLRNYPRMPFGGKLPENSSYLAMISICRYRPSCDAWPIRLPEPLPILPIPLRSPDPAVLLDLQAALHTAYDEARYDLRIDYNQAPPSPALSEADTAWVKTVLSEQNL